MSIKRQVKHNVIDRTIEEADAAPDLADAMMQEFKRHREGPDVSGRQDRVVVWSDHEHGRAYRSHSRSRRLALEAACDLISQHHAVQHIIGPEGVTIGQEEIERYCRDRPRPP
jgi:hypothetical protein